LLPPPLFPWPGGSESLSGPASCLAEARQTPGDRVGKLLRTAFPRRALLDPVGRAACSRQETAAAPAPRSSSTLHRRSAFCSWLRSLVHLLGLPFLHRAVRTRP